MSLDKQGAGHVPANERAGAFSFVELLRPMMLGDRICAAGDVLGVKHPTERPRTIMPVDPMLYQDRAERLINQKLARPHPGPATVQLGASLRNPAEEVERAELKPERLQAGHATAPPQRRTGGGAI